MNDVNEFTSKIEKNRQIKENEIFNYLYLA